VKRIVIGLLIGILFLTACGGTPSQTQSTIVPVSRTSTPTFLPTSTQTSIPSATPTASITPLPTIPTFTPTFDAPTILTVTPAPKAECPREDLSLKPNFNFLNNSLSKINDVTDPILNYLNDGGAPNSAVEVLQNIFKNKHIIYFEDVTGDSIPELISDDPFLWIAGCNAGKYKVMYFNSEAGDVENLATVTDLNLDGVKEIVFYDTVLYAAATFYRILEWDGNNFSDLLSNNGNIEAGGPFAEVHFINSDGGGVEKLIIDIGIRGNNENLINGPLRRIYQTYTWDGYNYIISQSEFSAPEYRFQAIQDADHEVLNGRFDKALTLYQESIQSSRLNWWSKTRHEYNVALGTSGTVLPTPFPDPTEYPRLAAYAYYRIMLLHLIQNNESDATTVYNTLREKFGNDQYGHPYVEMATAFWEAYQSTHKMYDGCAAAIQYAAEHPEILTPLGSDYHGAQSHTYVPADICPFR